MPKETLTDLDGTIALDGHSYAMASLREVIPDRHVLSAAIVP